MPAPNRTDTPVDRMLVAELLNHLHRASLLALVLHGQDPDRVRMQNIAEAIGDFHNELVIGGLGR